MGEDDLVAYLGAARRAGDRHASALAVAMLVWGFMANVKRRVALKVPPNATEEVAQSVLLSALNADFDGWSVGEFRNWIGTDPAAANGIRCDLGSSQAVEARPEVAGGAIVGSSALERRPVEVSNEVRATRCVPRLPGDGREIPLSLTHLSVVDAIAPYLEHPSCAFTARGDCPGESSSLSTASRSISSGDAENRTRVRGHLGTASTSVSGPLISSRDRLAGGVLRDQPLKLSPARQRRTSGASPLFDPGGLPHGPRGGRELAS